MLSRIVSIIKNLIFSVLLIVVLSVLLEIFFDFTKDRIILDSAYGYSIYASSFLLAIIIFTVGWFVKKRVERTESLKSKFVAVAAHRLRTPLSRIQWGLDEIYESEFDKKTVREKIDSMKNTTKDTIILVNSLLDATEAENTSVYYDYIFERGSVESIVRQVISDYSAGVNKKNIKLNVSIDENLPEINIDKERIRMVVGTFVENALMYTNHNGKIDLELYKRGNSIIFSARDNGIGISKESLPNIFSKFFRTKEAVAVSTDRVGLALFIAKEIIKKHRGTIHVESDGIMRGSHFWFSLPIS